MLNISWRESRLHCVKSVRIQSYSGPYFRAFELNTDQNNSKYGNFLCSVNPTNWLIQFLREISSNIIYDHYFLRKFRKCQSSSIFSNVQANNIQLSKWTNVNSQSPWNKQNEFSERCQIWFRASLKAIPFTIPAGNYMFKVNNRNTRTRCEICSKLTIKIPERCHWRRSGILIANFGHILHLVLVVLLLTLNM